MLLSFSSYVSLVCFCSHRWTGLIVFLLLTPQHLCNLSSVNRKCVIEFFHCKQINMTGNVKL